MSSLKKRFIKLSFFLFSTAIGLFLILWVFQEQVLYFYTPTDLMEKIPPADKTIRLGGLVEKGSLQKKYIEGKQKINFILTDGHKESYILYEGSLPDLFREGQGVIAEGKIIDRQGDTFILKATSLLAKHDETYMPPEVARSLKQKEQEESKLP